MKSKYYSPYVHTKCLLNLCTLNQSGSEKEVSSLVCKLLFLSLFAGFFYDSFILQIHINFTYVKFAFSLFQDQIAACRTSKFELLKASCGTACFTEVTSSVSSSACKALFFRLLLFSTLLLQKYGFVMNNVQKT